MQPNRRDDDPTETQPHRNLSRLCLVFACAALISTAAIVVPLGATSVASPSGSALRVRQRRKKKKALTKAQVIALIKKYGGGAGRQGPEGAPGAPGKEGTNGQDGARGEKGDTGVSVVSSAESAGANCAEGGSKFVAGASTTYACNGENGTDGADGTNGNTVLNGTGAPGSGEGVDGDFYIDTSGLEIYGPKASGAWGAGTPLTGGGGSPTGPAGGALTGEYPNPQLAAGSVGTTNFAAGAIVPKAENADELGGKVPSEFAPSSVEGAVAALQDEVSTMQGELASLESAKTALQGEVSTLKTELTGVHRGTDQSGYPTLFIEGENVQITNGEGATASANGRGNLIIGYDTLRESGNERGGSHNLVLGDEQSYASYGGVLGGDSNSVSSPYATVFGDRNTAGGNYSVVAGGEQNRVFGNYSVVAGGEQNDAGGNYSVVAGGEQNEVYGNYSVVAGGQSNFPDGEYETFLGGQGNRGYALNGLTVSGGQGEVPPAPIENSWYAGTGTYHDP